MELNKYQQLAKTTKNEQGTFEQRLANWALGLTGESGETADHIKKIVFHKHKIDIDTVEKEIGDVLWYVAILADEFNLDLEDIAKRNIDKLAERYPEGFSEYKSKQRKEYGNSDK